MNRVNIVVNTADEESAKEVERRALDFLNGTILRDERGSEYYEPLVGKVRDVEVVRESVVTRTYARTMPDNREVVAQLVESIQQELLSLVAPDAPDRKLADSLRHARTFSELHDYMDANMLGETDKVHEMVVDQDLTEEYVSRFRHYDEARVQHGCDVLNEAQDAVDAWMFQGGLDPTRRLLIDVKAMVDRLDKADGEPKWGRTELYHRLVMAIGKRGEQ